ncbi:MAG: hypothetical protein M3R46_17470 [Actinomycetota bacterium]|nr:hypothetical protein [Solirubrobacterales bacterium]MDQ3093407.1 hypothetical protein [Actinomycetota bacterium]
MENLPNRTARPTADQDDEDAIDVRFLTDAVQEDKAADEQAGFPVIEWYLGQPVPDLNEIEEERWPVVLTPLTQPVREAAARRVRSRDQSLRATALVLLELEACDREHRVLTMRGVEHMLWEERSRG